MNISLTKFCKDNDLAKTSVYRRCEELKINTSNGLNPDDVALLCNEFGVSLPATSAPVTVEVGNHAESKLLHIGVNAVNLEQFRTNRTRSQLANRLEFMNQSADLLEQIEKGMDEAEIEAELELQEIRIAKRQTKRRIENFHRRVDQYRIKTDILASLQNTELDELDELASEMNSLGKPDAPTSQP